MLRKTLRLEVLMPPARRGDLDRLYEALPSAGIAARGATADRTVALGIRLS
jgi:hypothetical protein